MNQEILQSSTAYPLIFLMLQSSDHITPLTGASPTVMISKNGGSFASPSGAVTEISNGWYKVAGNANDTNTLGPIILHATAASGDPSDTQYQVVAFNPQDAVRLGLTALPNANASASGGLLTYGTSAGQLNAPSGGIVWADVRDINGLSTSSVTTISANVGTTQPVNFTGTGTAALAKSDMVDIAGAAVSTSIAQIGANAIQLAGQTITAAAGVTFPSSVASPTNITAGTITTVTTTTTATNLTNAPTNGDLTAAMKSSLNSSTPAAITGSVGSVAGDVEGNVNGDVIGGVRGGVSGDLEGDVTGIIQGNSANQFAGVGVQADLQTIKAQPVTATAGFSFDSLATLIGKFTGITSIANWLRTLALSKTPDATALSEINSGGGTFSAAADSLQAIASTSGTGANTMTIHVKDSVTNAAVVGAAIRVSGSVPAETDPSGNAVVVLDSGTYTVAATNAPGYLNALPATEVVDGSGHWVASGTGTLTITMVAQVIPSPPGPNQLTVSGKTVDQQGNAIPNATVYFKIVDEVNWFTATSDGSGTVAATLDQSTKYAWRTATESSNYFTTGTGSSQSLGNMTGTWV